MKKVLILEDEVNIRSFVVINLKRAGYDAIEAGTGQEVLDRFRRRVERAAQESGDNRLIFAPGCSLPLDIDEETVHLLRVAADEYNAKNA